MATQEEMKGMAKKEEASGESSGEGRKTTQLRPLTPFEEMDRMFGSLFPRTRMRPFEWEWPSWAEMSAF